MRLAPLVLLLAACQIDRKSDELRCDVPTDCTGGRTCMGGWCVLDPSLVPDAEPPGDGTQSDADLVDAAPPDAGTCPAPCTECSAGRCVVRCDTAGACPGPITCPANLACEVICSGDGSCGGLIDCDATCACDVTCTGAGSCAAGADCRGPMQCDTGAGCTSSGGPCDQC